MAEELTFEALLKRLENQQRMHDNNYLYDHLTEHLYTHNSMAELKSLFADHHWLHVRVRQRNGSYDGYLKDLEFAWKAAISAATRQIEKNEEAYAIVDCIRYLLLQASINSLVRDTVPELVIRALELGLWKPQRVLNLIREETDNKKRASFCLQLLRTEKLSQEQVYEVQQLGLQAALAIEHVPYRINALSDLVPYLADDLIGPVLSVALTKEYHAGDEDVKIFAALAPCLQEDALERALKAALDIAYEDTQAMAVCALVPYLSEERRAGILKQLVDASGEIWHDDFRNEMAKVLRLLAPFLTGDLLEQAVAMTWYANEGDGDVDALCALVQRLPEQQRIKEVEAMLRGILNEGGRDEHEYNEPWHNAAIGELTLLLPEERRIEFLKQAFQKTMAINDEQNRAMALVELLPFLPDDWHAQSAKQAWHDFQAIELDGFLADNLCSLLAHLPVDMLEDTLQFTIAIEDEGTRAKVLSALIPRLTGTLLQRSIEVALAIVGDWGERAEPLTALVPQLEGEQRTFVIKRALKAILSRNDDDRARYLKFLVPYMAAEVLVPELRSSRIIEAKSSQIQAISKLSVYLPEEQRIQVLDREFQETRDMIYSWERAKVLKALAQYVPEALFEQVLQAMQDLVPEPEWPEIWISLAPRLSETFFERIVQMALSVEKEWTRAQVLKPLIPLLPQALREHVLSAAFDFASDRDRVEVLTVLVPYLTDTQFEHIWQVATSIEKDEWRAQMLCALALRLVETDFKRVVDAAVTIKDDRYRARVFEVLVPYVDEIQKRVLQQFEVQGRGESQTDQPLQPASPSSEMSPSVLMGAELAQAWQAALAVGDDWQRAQELARILPSVGESATLVKDIRKALAAALQSSSEEVWSQQKVLQLLATQEFFAPPVLAVETLATIISYIDEICRHWKWQ